MPDADISTTYHVRRGYLNASGPDLPCQTRISQCIGTRPIMSYVDISMHRDPTYHVIRGYLNAPGPDLSCQTRIS
eukprot:612341-Prorocentrum_minimum.AAC.1